MASMDVSTDNEQSLTEAVREQLVSVAVEERNLALQLNKSGMLETGQRDRGSRNVNAELTLACKRECQHDRTYLPHFTLPR